MQIWSWCKFVVARSEEIYEQIQGKTCNVNWPDLARLRLKVAVKNLGFFIQKITPTGEKEKAFGTW